MLLKFDTLSLLTPDLGLVFWTTIIFLVFWFIVGKKALGPIANAIKDREASINDALNAAEKAKAEMSQLQADNANLLKEAREESAKILKEAKDIKESVIADAHNRAKDEAAKIIADAKAEIDTQKKKALEEVKNELSQFSVEIAEKILNRELSTSKDHQQYINSLVENINNN
ncbi:MAG TPA: F0F1 ATP synthase subunit B [Chitinophagales bacterium]|nr:F0F1 ATP synthase subunit B [Chitinophagales bacterium]MCB0513292.1 F0F1 ATP synthase subunit B [Bacteroidota bacterium]MCB9074551.1 F0F1 ATP synthase subunit B [Chitinophagales bacterium]HMU97477.1 F0F1 ATP synthase subunit B [Chitinophagales bacterium]HMV01872.1 F0F1 ATP synthase subunit B [Chitinophagales bacterium]